jgi:branched-chain amino acid transport system substrate-binding protein
VVAIGDGLPRVTNGRSFVKVVQLGIDSAGARGVRVEPWTVGDGDFERSEASQAERYAELKELVAVVGHAGSKGTLLALPTYKLAGIPVVVPSATSRQLHENGALIFMMAPDDSVEGAFIADAVIDSLHSRRVAVVYVADAYGTGIRDGVAQQLAARSMQLAGEAATAGRECLATSPLPLQGIVRALIKRAKPEAIVLGLGGPQAACAVRVIKAVDPTIRVIAADSFDPSLPIVTRLDSAQRAGVYFVSFWDPALNAQSRALVERTQRLLQRDPSAGDALNYDAYMAVAAAIAAGNRTRGDVARFLSELGTPGHPPLEGATGLVSFEAPRRSILRLRQLSDEHLPR